MINKAHVEREGETLTVTFDNGSPAVTVAFGAAFTAMSVIGLAFFGLIALILLFLAWRSGGLRGIARGVAAGGAGAFAPFAMLLLFVGTGVYLIRWGRKPVFDEAEVWIFNRADRSFTVATRKYEQRTGRRWLQTSNVYSFPPPESVAIRYASASGDYDEYDISVQMSSGQTVKRRTNQINKRDVAQINQFLAGN